MKIYDEFHGDTNKIAIGKKLREIVQIERQHFKILTGYGSSSGCSISKITALKSLAKMEKEGLIKGYFPGEVKNELLNNSSPYYKAKTSYGKLVKNDPDFGNDGIIFIFL